MKRTTVPCGEGGTTFLWEAVSETRVVCYDYVHPDDRGKPRNLGHYKRSGDNLKLTFENGKLAAAEVLK